MTTSSFLNLMGMEAARPKQNIHGMQQVQCPSPRISFCLATVYLETGKPSELPHELNFAGFVLKVQCCFGLSSTIKCFIGGLASVEAAVR